MYITDLLPNMKGLLRKDIHYSFLKFSCIVSGTSIFAFVLFFYTSQSSMWLSHHVSSFSQIYLIFLCPYVRIRHRRVKCKPSTHKGMLMWPISPPTWPSACWTPNMGICRFPLLGQQLQNEVSKLLSNSGIEEGRKLESHSSKYRLHLILKESA